MTLLSLVLAAVAGLATVAGFAPYGLFPVPVVTVALLFALLGRRQSWRGGFAIGMAWGLGLFLGGVSWLFVALHRYGGMPVPMAATAVSLFCAYLALFPGVAGALWVALRRRRAVADALLAAGLWTLSEWLRGIVLTGFPWLALGYSQTPPSPLAPIAPLLGVYGIGFCLVLAGAALGLADWRSRAPLPALLLTLALAAGGWSLRTRPWTEPAGAPLSVSLVQTDIEQSLKWRADLQLQWLRVNLDLVREHPARLVVLPETTLPMLAAQLPPGYLATLTDAVGGHGGDLVFGVFLREADGAIHNAALATGASGHQRYAKNHLVPFGEYSPPMFGWFYDWANIPMSDQTPGGANQPPMAFDDQRIAINICYEDLFGAEIAAAAADATVLLNMSNLAWYGDSLAQPQHLQIARMRALETGRPMLRATNTGMTAVVAHDGRVAGVLPAFERGALSARVQGRSGSTPYMRWRDRPALALALAALTASLLLGRRPAPVAAHDSAIQ